MIDMANDFLIYFTVAEVKHFEVQAHRQFRFIFDDDNTRVSS